MRKVAWVGAALALALTAGCKDRDHGEADDQVQASADRAGNAVDSAAHDVGDDAYEAMTADAQDREGDRIVAAVDPEALRREAAHVADLADVAARFLYRHDIRHFGESQ